jgi:hypothetical protein
MDDGVEDPSVLDERVKFDETTEWVYEEADETDP